MIKTRDGTNAENKQNAISDPVSPLSKYNGTLFIPASYAILACGELTDKLCTAYGSGDNAVTVMKSLVRTLLHSVFDSDSQTARQLTCVLLFDLCPRLMFR